VRRIFSLHPEFGSIQDLKIAQDQRGIRSKSRRNAAGKKIGQLPIARDAPLGLRD
jgi:hypothetical protein